MSDEPGQPAAKPVNRRGHAKRPHRRRLPAFSRPHPPGTSPGTLAIDPHAPAPRIRVIAYGPDDIDQRDVADPRELGEFMGRWPVVWVNVDGLGDRSILTAVGEIFDVHRLALEDVVHVHQRAKVEPYEQHLFIVARMVRAGVRLETEQVTCFLGKGTVLTFQEREGDCFDLVRQRIASGRVNIRQGDASYLCYALLDALIDAYFPVLESYGDRLEQLEDDVILNPARETVTELHVLRRELLSLRRAIWPHREAISALLRDESPFVAADTRLYLRDCYDHAIQILDLVETYRELATGLMDLYLSSVSNRMNEIMKVLTIFAAIFIPLSFVAGLYGMNFDTSSPWNMPELTWRYGYPFLLGLMGVVAGGLLLLFRRRGWIGSPRRNGASPAGGPDDGSRPVS